MDSNTDIVNLINKIKKEKNAVILGHYYQDQSIQDVCDFIGDSLELSKKALKSDADLIVFCGVKFMAEVAKIINPNKKVLLPDINAGCSLEEQCDVNDFKKFREENPEYLALTYINCSAEVKAESDIIVTSSNAEKIINSIPKDQKIIFSPDKYLGGYLKKLLNRDNMELWNGSCMVHEQFSEKELVKLKMRHPEAYVIAHPECPENLLNYADFIGSTSKLLSYTADKDNSEFIVLTEPGIIYQMEKNSNNKFYSVNTEVSKGCFSCNTCPHMRLNTLEKLYNCLLNEDPEIILSDSIIKKARIPIDRMLELS